MMNKRWIAMTLGLAITLSGGGLLAAQSQEPDVEANSRTPINQIEETRSLQALDAQWNNLLSDFQKVADLEEAGNLEEAQMLWEQIIPEVDSKLGIEYVENSQGENGGYDEGQNQPAGPSQGWVGYINTFSDLITDQQKLDQLMDFASDLDSLTVNSPMVDKLEKQISVLLTDALEGINLEEAGSIFAEPSQFEGAMEEADVEQYGKLLDLYLDKEATGDFEAAQDKYDEIIELLNKYPELSAGPQSELYAQYQVKNEKLTEIKKPVDEMGQDMKITEVSDADKKQHQLLWDYVVKLMPDSATDYVDKFEIGSDGKDGTMAFVYATDESGKKFVLNLDIKDMTDANGKFSKKDMDETIVHEFGHIITLNNTQMTDKSAGTYETQEGILNKDSYLNKFYDQFWKSKTEKYLLSNEGGMRQYDVEKLYSEHEAWFVSDYAATNVEEDIAESFRVFVLENKATGNSVKDQKVNFFYQFPELVKMRTEIRDGK